jgi:hypothetical protein
LRLSAYMCITHSIKIFAKSLSVSYGSYPRPDWPRELVPGRGCRRSGPSPAFYSLWPILLFQICSMLYDASSPHACFFSAQVLYSTTRHACRIPSTSTSSSDRSIPLNPIAQAQAQRGETRLSFLYGPVRGLDNGLGLGCGELPSLGYLRYGGTKFHRVCVPRIFKKTNHGLLRAAVTFSTLRSVIICEPWRS